MLDSIIFIIRTDYEPFYFIMLFAAWIPFSAFALEKRPVKCRKAGLIKRYWGKFYFLITTFLFMVIKTVPVATARIPPLSICGKTAQTKWCPKVMIQNCLVPETPRPCFMQVMHRNFITTKKFKIILGGQFWDGSR